MHCCISNYNDIINTYNAKDQESLNPDFVEFLHDAADPIPDECPLVLNVIGDFLSEEEKKIVTEIIRDDFSYKLGIIEKEQEREFKFFVFMLIGSIVGGLLMWLTDFLDEAPREIFIVFFWFFGDRIFEYLFITRHELRQEQRLAGRLASIKFIFSDSYKKYITRKSKSASCTPNLTWNNESTICIEVKQNEENIYH
ncbi:MAG: hypothetical protein IJK81_07650 [Selenomonadaceae bacterium]|nr:hypothetical protein [Selenomonadaceae bacterium]